jgi:hypothetical protein
MRNNVAATTLLMILCLPVSAAERGLRVSASEGFLPALEAIVVVKAGEAGPGSKECKPLARATSYQETLRPSGDGPFDVWWQPKKGLAVKAFAEVRLADGIKELKLDERLGIVRFRGDTQPRARLVTITAKDDPGPDEKGHVALQTATEYRVDMVVPEGFYSLWITPDNGARAIKVVDRFRVHAGRVSQIDD